MKKFTKNPFRVQLSSFEKIFTTKDFTKILTNINSFAYLGFWRTRIYRMYYSWELRTYEIKRMMT